MKYSIIIYKKEDKKQSITYLNGYMDFDSALIGLKSLGLDFTGESKIKQDKDKFWARLNDGMIVRIEKADI